MTQGNQMKIKSARPFAISADIDQDEVRKWWATDQTLLVIARAMQVSERTMRKVVREMSLPKRTHLIGRRLKLHDTPEIRAMWDAGKAQRTIAAHAGVSDYAIAALAKRCGYPKRSMAGGARGGTFWTDEERAKTVAMRHDGYTYAEIACATGRAISSIGEIVRSAGLSKPRNQATHYRTAPPPVPKPKDLSLSGRLIDTKGNYEMLLEIAKVQGWTHIQAQQRYHRAMSGGVVE